MNGLDFVRGLLDEAYAYLVAYKHFPEDVAKSLVGNILMDLQLKLVHGLVVMPIYMNPDGSWMFICDTGFYTDFSVYYCIATTDNRIPEIEYNDAGIPTVYENVADAKEVLALYYNYFANEHLEIIAYKP